MSPEDLKKEYVAAVEYTSKMMGEIKANRRANVEVWTSLAREMRGDSGLSEEELECGEKTKDRLWSSLWRQAEDALLESMGTWRKGTYDTLFRAR